MSDLSGAVRALDADSGKVLWTFHASGAVKHGPALADGNVFFGDYAGVMYSLRASDGHLRLAHPDERPFRRIPARQLLLHPGGRLRTRLHRQH